MKPFRGVFGGALIILAVAAIYLYWLVGLNTSTNHLYDVAGKKFMQSQVDYLQSVALVRGKAAITLLKNDPFRPGTPWAYVSARYKLPVNYSPPLVTVTVPHSTSGGDVRLSPLANKAIARLFSGAEHEGHSLMVSSGYRSANQQQQLLYQTEATQGSAAAHRQIADPGASEHQTGYAVDVDDASTACQMDAGACSISSPTAAWLAKNAPRYGFIIRYPSGKEATTGIKYEPWHLRYVGKAAPVLTASKLTLDEFVQKVDPELFR